MFNLLDIGERAGSGIPNIYHIWNEQKWESPQITERLDRTERIKLTLPIENSSDKTKTSDKQAIKTSDKTEMIFNFIEKGKKYKTVEIADVIGLSPARTRVYLKELVDAGKLKCEGINKSKVYYLL